MALRVKLRDEALADLESISNYISQFDSAAADRVIQRVHTAIHRTLTQIPSAGRMNVEGTAREYPVPGLPYLVLYVATAELIDVVGVFHSSKNPTDKPKP